MLAQKGWTDIHVYDRLPPAPSPDDETVWGDTARFYLIGLGGRGQKALKELRCWDQVDRYDACLSLSLSFALSLSRPLSVCPCLPRFLSVDHARAIVSRARSCALSLACYGVATISRLLKIIGPFCKRAP